MPLAFVCIGAQKGGTRWLYDQFASHAGVKEPPMKEIGFFDEELQKNRGNLATRLALAKRKLDTRIEAHERGREDHSEDIGFLLRYLHFHGEGKVHSGGRYAQLFEMFGRPSMDVSPNYSRFANLKAAALSDAAPEAKIVFLVRDPAARLWSAARMQARRQGREEVVRSLEGLQAYAALDGVRARSTQARALRVWRKAAGERRVGAYPFDRLTEDPAALRAEIAKFCGLDPDAFAAPAEEDRKAARSEPVATPPGAARWMAEFFAAEYEALAPQLPPFSEAWAARAEALRSGREPD